MFQCLDEGVAAGFLPGGQGEALRMPFFFGALVVILLHPARFQSDQVAGDPFAAEIERVADRFRIVGDIPADIPEAERPFRRQFRFPGQVGVKRDQFFERRRGEHVEIQYPAFVIPAETVRIGMAHVEIDQTGGVDQNAVAGRGHEERDGYVGSDVADPAAGFVPAVIKPVAGEVAEADPVFVLPGFEHRRRFLFPEFQSAHGKEFPADCVPGGNQTVCGDPDAQN